MKRIKPVILSLLLIFMLASLTACGRNNNNTTATTGSSQSSSQAATSASGGTKEDTGTAGTRETREGVIDGLINDMEDGAEDVKEGMEHMTDETAGTTNAGSAATTGAER